DRCADNSLEAKLPRPAEATASVWALGVMVIMLIAPATALRPNSVPCGPFRTSTRSTPSRFMIVPRLLATKALSMYVATLGSEFGWVRSVPMPRRYGVAYEALLLYCRLGTRNFKSWVVSILDSARLAAENAWMVIGTD